MSTFGAFSANGIKDADKLTEAVGNAVAVFGGGAKEYSSVALCVFTGNGSRSFTCSGLEPDH